MSAKNTKKTGNRLIIAVAVVAVLLIAVIFLLFNANTHEAAKLPDNVIDQSQEQAQQESQENLQPQRVLKETLEIQEIGEYTGLYVEDGSDEAVSGLLMMVVTNISEDPIQYAEIVLDVEGQTAKFTVSVLPAGGSAVLIEQNRMEYSDDIDYTQVQAECVHLAGFDKALSLHEDLLEIQLLDGALNITNISGNDITDTIILCYKNASNGVYHGGIAYRIKLEGGLKAGELRQIMATHLHQPGSELLFVDFAA